MSTEWIKIGTIGVDAGLCWIGDPCYILHKESPLPMLGTSWSDFCDKLGSTYPVMKQFGRGIGMCVSTGYGDGTYDVEVKLTKDNRIKEVRVVFIEDEYADEL